MLLIVSVYNTRFVNTCGDTAIEIRGQSYESDIESHWTTPASFGALPKAG